MLLRGEHDDDKDELRGEEHLDEETPRYARAPTKRGGDRHGAREASRGHGSGANAAYELGKDDDQRADQWEAPDEEEGECDLFQG